MQFLLAILWLIISLNFQIPIILSTSNGFFSLTVFEISPFQERKSMTHSVGEPPASSTPSLSRSSSVSGADNAGLHTSVLSQVHTLAYNTPYMKMCTFLLEYV